MVKEAFSKKKPPSEPGSETGEGWETGQKNRPMLPYIKESFWRSKRKKITCDSMAS